MDNEVCKQHSGILQLAQDVKKDTSKQWDEIDKIKNRPPVWCTVVIAVLSASLGSVLTYAALVVRIATAAKAAH